MTLVLFGTPPDRIKEKISRTPGLTALARKKSARDSEIQVFSTHGAEAPELFEDQNHLVAVLGSPEYRGAGVGVARSASEVYELFRTNITEVDSTFVAFSWDKSNTDLVVYSDRFGSKVLFYFAGAEYALLSTEVRLLNLFSSVVANQKVDNDAIFEFLWFRRLFGQKTYFSNVRCIVPASRTVFAVDSPIRIEKYWAATQSNLNLSMADWAERIRVGIQNGAESAIARPGQCGLMLSGGLDSRALLAIAKNRVVTITNTPSINQEYQVAKELADLINVRHVHIRRPPDYLDKVFVDAMQASNGMTLFYECQFLGYKDVLRGLVDRIQLGLFLDIFFCGHYMPKRHRRIGNRQSVHFIPELAQKKDFVSNFINGVSYRMKTTKIDSVVRPSVFRRGFESISAEISSISKEGHESGFSGTALWEYMHLTNLGRHYSMLMASSLGAHISVDLPVLTNDNYNTALMMPGKLKINWQAYIEALRRLDPLMMKIRNANLNFPANYGLRAQTGLKVLKSIVNALQPDTFQLSPNVEDRSWPLVKETIINPTMIRQEIEKMLRDGKILDLGILDVERARQLFQLTRDNVEDHSVFLNQLLTIEKGFLDQL